MAKKRSDPKGPAESSVGGLPDAARALGAVGGLGIECAGLVVAGAFLGSWIDEHTGQTGFGTLAGVLLGMFGFGVHLRYLLVVDSGASSTSEAESPQEDP
jgi:F0F1-type ATP synthase assembly protein I